MLSATTIYTSQLDTLHHPLSKARFIIHDLSLQASKIHFEQNTKKKKKKKGKTFFVLLLFYFSKSNNVMEDVLGSFFLTLEKGLFFFLNPKLKSWKLVVI